MTDIILSEILWVILPYFALSVFVVVNVYRYFFDSSVWTSKSSELLEKRRLKWGSLMFHYGLIFVFLGHVGGLIIPESLTQSMGIAEAQYRMSALWIGGIAGTITIAGLLLLLYRRLSIRSVRSAGSLSDMLVLFLLLLVMVMGVFNTLASPALFTGFDYRLTISPWFRDLFLLQPNASLMTTVPVSFQMHVIAAMALAIVWPFTRLVHAWTIPIRYLRRAPVVYRAKPKPSILKIAKGIVLTMFPLQRSVTQDLFDS